MASAGHGQKSRGQAWWHLAQFPVPAHQTGLAALPHPAFRLTSPKGTRRVADSIHFINKNSLKEWNQKEFAAKLREPESTKPISSNLVEQIPNHLKAVFNVPYGGKGSLCHVRMWESCFVQ